MRRPYLLAVLATAACSSAAPTPQSDPPSAEPIAFRLNQSAKGAKDEVTPDPKSPSRVLGYVEGEVITYRDVLLKVGPQIAMLENPEEKDRLEESTLLDIVEERLVYYAALDAHVDVTRDRVEQEVASDADLVGFYLPMHTATRLATPVIRRVRSWNTRARICAFGLYAALNADWLRSLGVEVIDLNSSACVKMMAEYIRANPEVWNEDIGEE